MSKDLIAEFIAKNGVKRLPEGASNGMTTRDWYKAARAEYAPRVDDTPRVAVVDHAGRTWYKNSQGEVIGHD